MQRNIVVGVDLTPASTTTVRQALRLASWEKATVRPVHVIDILVAADLQATMSLLQESITQDLVAGAKETWKAIAAGVPGAAALELDVRIAPRALGVLDAARENRADLLVLGAHRSGKNQVGVGTVATTCIRRAMSDVVLVREGMDHEFATVVAATDFSEASRPAIERAAYIAQRDGSSLHILHVFDPPWRKLNFQLAASQPERELRQQAIQSLEQRLSDFVAPILPQWKGPPPTLAVFEYVGHRSGIVEYSEKVRAGLIVLGTRGRSNLRDMLLGSTAEKALSHTTCSVWTVPPRA